MPRPGLPGSRLPGIAAVVLLACASTAPVSAGAPKVSRYPLRVHVLAADESHKTPRMNPGDALSCDAIDDMMTSISFSQMGPISVNGSSSDPCSIGADRITGRLLDLGDDAPVFSGAGRGDLVSPPRGTEGISFRYDDCSRVRVHPGFQSLPARWKQPGRKLEVLIPSDEIPLSGKPLAPVRCTFNVTTHDFVYLLLPNGKVVEISQDDYWKRPGLRVFLSGRVPLPMQPRQFTVSAHPNNPNN